MKRILFTIFISLGLLVGFSSSVYAAEAPEIVSAADPAGILKVAKRMGPAELSTDSDGDPKITGKMEGKSYTIYFYGCTDNKDCSTIQFSRYWEGYDVSAEAVQKWSWERGAMAKAGLDEDNDPRLRMRLNLDKGVTAGNLANSFLWWVVLTESFEKEVLKVGK